MIIAFAFIMPWNNKLGNIALLAWIIVFAFTKKRSGLLVNELIIICTTSSFLLIRIVSLVYSTDLANGISNIEKLFPVIVFMILFPKAPSMRLEMLKLALKAFVASVFLINILAIVKAVFAFLGNDDSFGLPFSTILNEYFSYVPLSSNVNFHPTYLSLYTVSAMVIASVVLKSVYRWLLVIFFIAMVVLLASRIALVAVVPVLILLLFQRANRGASIFVSIALLFLLAVAVYSSPALFDRFLSDFLVDTKKDEFNGVTMRLWHWNASIRVLKENAVIGVGIGDAQRALDIEYCKMGVNELYGFNSHNQILFDMIGMGAIGGLMTLALFLTPFLIFFRRKDYWVAVFFLVPLIFSFTECIFAIKKGIIFYSFFLSFFCFQNVEWSALIKREPHQIAVNKKRKPDA